MNDSQENNKLTAKIKELENKLKAATRDGLNYQNNELFCTYFFDKNEAILLLIKQDNGEIIRVNQAAKDFYQYTDQQWQDMTIPALEKNKTTLTQKRFNIVNHFQKNTEFTHYDANNNEKYVQILACPFENPNEKLILLTINDISENKQRRDTLKQKRINLRHASVHAHIGYWTWEAENNKVIWSNELYRIFHLNFKTSVNKDSLFKFIHPEDIENVKKQIDIAYERKRSCSFEFRFYRTDNELRYARAIADITYDSEGNAIFLFGTLQDITSQKKAEKEILQAKKRAEQADKLKSMFLANMSHEIRTPLNAINGYTNLLLNSTLSTKQQKYLSNIKISTNNLLFVINDILDFSKIEEGKLSIENIDFDIIKTLNDFFVAINIKAVEKDIRLTKVIGKEVPQFLKGDPYRLNQVLTNLLSNAIKFTNEGGVVDIKVDLIKYENEKYLLLFEVKDTGIGIPEEKLQVIFKAFTQANAETTRKYGGTGLGLSIVKNLIKLMGGTISVNSKLNQGTTFSIKLPFEKGLPIKNTETTQKIDNALDISGLKILLVEDNKVNQEITIDTILLYNDNVKIETAENGKIAVQKVMNNYYDLIIMDIQMPEMDGYEATRIIKNELEPPKNQIPIVGMSAHALKTEKEKCFALGMLNYITKPFEPEDLFKVLKTIAKESNFQHKTFKIPQTEEKFKYINLEYLPATYQKDQKKKKKILTMCLQNIPVELEELNNAFYQRNWDRIKETAHALKTLMFYLGLVAQKENLENLENNINFDKERIKAQKLVLEVNNIWKKAKIELEDYLS